MSDLDLLVPSALVDPGLAVDLLRDQALPHLARVFAHTRRRETVRLPDHASLTPWQSWVFARRAGVDVDAVNVAELWAMACGIAPSTGRFLFEPAHFQIAKDHLRLDDPVALGVTLPEARALAAAVASVLAEAGWRLDPLEPATLTHWPVSRVDDARLSAAAIDRAIGDNVAAWQPRSIDGGTAALAWRRCVNEVQMAWFADPVNAAREVEGRPTINTLWLSGNGAPRSAMPRYAAVDSSLPLLAALPIDPAASCRLTSFDEFIAIARTEDWSAWREALARLDARVGEALAGQKGGAVGTLTIVLCGRDALKVATIERGDFARFWRGWGRRTGWAQVFADEVPA